MDEHMLRAATKARLALAAELGEPSPDMAQALAIIEQMLGDIEAGRHPLDRPDDWPQRDRRPSALLLLGGILRGRQCCLLGLLRWGRKIVEEVCFDGGGFRGRGASAQLLVLDILVRKSYLKERATWARVGGARKAPLVGGC